MNAISLAPRQVQPQDRVADEGAESLRLLPASESAETGDGNALAPATAAAPFWTWFIENPRRPRSV